MSACPLHYLTVTFCRCMSEYFQISPSSDVSVFGMSIFAHGFLIMGMPWQLTIGLETKTDACLSPSAGARMHGDHSHFCTLLSRQSCTKHFQQDFAQRPYHCHFFGHVIQSSQHMGMPAKQRALLCQYIHRHIRYVLCNSLAAPPSNSCLC